ncbi:Os05g0357550 [Oryza sativa Japonica Group]|uniref:Os05g0357550 protein n=1 Tax=Oryza sativa subsp. japonica TaxID=39947 RepID=A0A0P0WL70_ORYSJ|nr:Os05g0357550 [Oryza sativa Japonica Group]
MPLQSPAPPHVCRTWKETAAYLSMLAITSEVIMYPATTTQTGRGRRAWSSTSVSPLEEETTFGEAPGERVRALLALVHGHHDPSPGSLSRSSSMVGSSTIIGNRPHHHSR